MATLYVLYFLLLVLSITDLRWEAESSDVMFLKS
jgi:hypothetical protein